MKSQSSKRRVLMLHCNYRIRGGEEESFEAEVKCFESLGFEVLSLVRSNEHVNGSLASGLNAIFSIRNFLGVWQTTKSFNPDLIYANNLWPAMSGSVLLAARLKAIPTIQALRNYRLITPSAKVDDAGCCVVCALPASRIGCSVRGCYQSKLASFVNVVSMTFIRMVVFRWNQHWYVSPSFVCRSLLTDAGVRSKRFLVRPNFFSLGEFPASTCKREVTTYVGRLSHEKGILLLAKAWPSEDGFVSLDIIGDGPLRAELESIAAWNSNIRVLGRMSSNDVLTHLASSLLSVVPSNWAEPFGRVAIESMAVGTPVLTLGNGALEEVTGPAGVDLPGLDADSISKVLTLTTDDAAYSNLVKACYSRFSTLYSAEAAASVLKDILMKVLPCDNRND